MLSLGHTHQHYPVDAIQQQTHPLRSHNIRRSRTRLIRILQRTSVRRHQAEHLPFDGRKYGQHG